MPVKVKICGITNLEDALVAVEAGADALGFVFYEKSPRYISIETASKIIKELPPSVTKLGVFVDAPLEDVLNTAQVTGLLQFQFHGNESVQYCDSFESRFRNMKAFAIRDENSLKALPAYATCDWLLDSWSPSQAGGIGETFNWDLAIKAHEFGRPFFLAGGLTPENVAAAIDKVKPYGVDVSSGVEAKPGKKDAEKVSAFIRAAKAAGQMSSHKFPEF